MKRKLLCTNVVYGQDYSNIFLNQHLQSLLDKTNIPAYTDRLEYLIFTDEQTVPILKAHPNFQWLTQIIPVQLGVFDFPPGADKFGNRYAALIHTFHSSVEKALELNYYCSAMVADLVFAKDYFRKVFSRLDAGYDSCFVLPLRSALEAIANRLPCQGALEAEALFNLGYECLHPLWSACHWESPQFSKMPFSLIWNTGSGLLVKSFSITPIAFTPYPEMLGSKQVIDVEIPSMCKNPFWATDWVDCPVIGVEPLQCYYPPFANKTSSITEVSSWAKGCLHPSQLGFLTTSLYYPSKQVANVSQVLLTAASMIAEVIVEKNN